MVTCLLENYFDQPSQSLLPGQLAPERRTPLSGAHLDLIPLAVHEGILHETGSRSVGIANSPMGPTDHDDG